MTNGQLQGSVAALVASAGLLAFAGCDKPPVVAPQPNTSASASASVAPPDAATLARRAFENPGGMWMPEQIAEHADTLRKLGLELDPAKLTDPMAFPLGAVIWLGGCSASFVSPDGLIITNHHCATGALQVNSTKDDDLLENGFLAASRNDERSNGPAARVYVTQSFEDVTKKMVCCIAPDVSHHDRYKIMEERSKDLISGCEGARSDVRCNVVSYFSGSKYMLIKQLQIRDVRLVYAPASSVGAYGGEVDNWRWPRHTGDVSFFRAYVGPDGKPADFSKKNVPYKPKHHLKVATKPLEAGDFVMVAGYPGRTTRLKTARQVQEAVEWYYPRRLKLCNDYIALLNRLRKEDRALGIKGERLYRGLSNVLTNTKGMLEGLTQGGLKNEKARLEKELRAWAATQPEHAAAAKAIDNMATHDQRYRGQRDSDAATLEAVWISTLLGAADTIVHMAEERPKMDELRHPSFQERNHNRLKQRQQQAQRSYARKLDQAKLQLALERAAQLPQAKRPLLLKLLLKNAEPTAANIAKALDALYAGTQLEKAEQRVKLLTEATTKQLRQSRDTFIQLALKLRPLIAEIDKRRDSYEGATVVDMPRYISALQAKEGKAIAPDANSTLRITYGTVRGYRPKPGAAMYDPFTVLSGMVAKHTGRRPFDAPAKVLEAAKDKSFGPYVHQGKGEVPVDFLADLDITGGNSGSATLNARGELVGLAFDGNYEARASGWLLVPKITRSIHVDIRYVLWLLDRVDGADHLLTEMGLTPALP